MITYFIFICILLDRVLDSVLHRNQMIFGEIACFFETRSLNTLLDCCIACFVPIFCFDTTTNRAVHTAATPLRCQRAGAGD